MGATQERPARDAADTGAAVWPAAESRDLAPDDDSTIARADGEARRAEERRLGAVGPRSKRAEEPGKETPDEVEGIGG
ncbi:MAG TPA: hypothetical protein VFW96_14905 [Thermomicrobiales bacterium]|nr:hypothetical protein [Thermomicrobiales bacterium]